ncbi:hydrogenase expression protein HupH [Baekduia soli]|uniref:Hydrogenase expression protein HupH n=1 Tax=Baekduia soli TaxID=496014 RepID=A0A5B8U1R9_9ACTN|nr:aspartate/glutamate racemase family protein [Baekduia soli]QEC46963.1 hydrogenase expression protein HupH [Baekduia soli]
MPKVCVLVPFALDEQGMANRRLQQESVDLGPDMEFVYKPVKAGPEFYDSYHDYVLADLGMLEAGVEAAEEGFDAVCIDTMSDSGVNALRSVLDIPVIAPGKASYLMALLLGHKFSVLTQWDGWLALYRKGLQEYGLTHLCASLRSINLLPDVSNLLGGKEEVVFPLLVEAGLQCVADGADVICLGSTTMHQAHAHLSEHLPVPVINPGPLTYKLAEAVLGLGLSQSRTAYPRPNVELLDVVQAMVAAGVQAKAARPPA